MYIKHPDSTELELQGITVYVPPEGWVYDRISGEWVETGVYSRSKKKAEQYWERQDLPEWYHKRRREEESMILATNNPDFFFEDCEQIRREHWFKRWNGMWFMNNGVPTYITGLNWFYLNWWPIDIGYPKYFKYDRLEFYHKEYCIEDPLCFGQLVVGPRRCGKTYKAGVFLFEAVSRSSFALGGIQSKTGPDAKKVFGKALVSQFRKLPHFFKPVYDTSQGTIPKSEIRFFQTSKKGQRKKIEHMEEELESIIDFRASGKFAYDGEKTLRLLHDEIFKTEEVDVYDRYGVVKECLVDPSTGTIIGKYLGTSTVEEVEGQIDRYEKMWLESNPEKRNDNGHTTSGLYRYFISAAQTRGLDKYGDVNEEENMKYIMNHLQSIKDDTKAYSDYKRKYPLNIADAFRPQAKDCHYDVELLNDRYDILGIIEPKYTTGNLKWNDPEEMSKGVRFVPSKNGNFLLHKDMDYKDDSMWNKVVFAGSKPRPMNKARFLLGNDPFDHKTTVDGRKSNGAGTVFYKYDPMNPLKSDKFVLTYCYRPKKPSIFYDDMLKICWFFGCQILFEDQKQGILQYFEGKNCDKFLLKLKDRKEPGIPASPKTHQSIVDHTSEYIEDCINLVDYPDLIKDWLKFDINKTTEYDLAMASGYTLIGVDRIRPEKIEHEEEIIEVTTVFRTYGN